ASIVAGTWGDTAGDLGVGRTQSFPTIGQGPSQSSGSTEQREFFIELSGGMMLQSGGLLGDSPDDPLLKITGDVKLTIRSDSTGTRFELTASCSIRVFKIADIPSGAADFVLNIGSGLSSISFYGVAA